MAKPAIIHPYLGLLIGIVAVSFASIFIRLAEAPPLVIAAYRLSLASLILIPLALARSRSELRRLTNGDFILALIAGLFLALHFASWITSLEYTSVASSVILVTIHPIFVGLASHLLLNEKLSRWRAMGIALSVLGGMIIGYGDFGLGWGELFGDLLAIAGAVMVAGYFLIGRRLRAKFSLLAYISLVYSVAAAITVILCLLTGQNLMGYPRQTYLMFILLALVPQLVGHSSFNWALKYLSATFIAVSILGEPIGSTILAYFILNEIPTITKMAGGALIMVGIYIASRGSERAKPSLKYILFDLDETLYPKESGLMQEISQRISLYMEERLRLEPDSISRLRQEYYACYGTTMRGLLVHYAIDPEDYLSYVHDITLENYIAPNKELDAALGKIKLEKVVFTNASTEHASRVLSILGVERHFKHIIDIRALDYISKPAPQAYQLALEILDAKGEECLIVDDNARNLMPAKKLGMTTVLVDNNDGGNSDVDFVIERVAEIDRVVEKLRK
ncbi:MAG: pyrimidine 5'-nucleotidase [Chloroflexota bacterium]|nr:pyrimidine 5'-nucleotidase [Chloroflexota bacterium]